MLTLQVASRVDEADGIAGLVLTNPQGVPCPSGRPAPTSTCTSTDRARRPWCALTRSAAIRPTAAPTASQCCSSRVERAAAVSCTSRCGRDSSFVSLCRNLFGFTIEDRMVFVAGGIGITPILPMIAAADAAGADWRLHYAGREPSTMAFGSDIERYGDRVRVYVSSEGERMAVPESSRLHPGPRSTRAAPPGSSMPSRPRSRSATASCTSSGSPMPTSSRARRITRSKSNCRSPAPR